MTKPKRKRPYGPILLVIVAFVGLIFLGYRLGKTTGVAAVLQDSLTLSVNTDLSTCNVVLSGEGRANSTLQLVFQYPNFTLVTTNDLGMYSYSIDPNNPSDPHYLAPGTYTANTQVAYPDKLTPVISNSVTFTITPGPCTPTPTITPIPTLTIAPTGNGMCHWNNGSKGWNALSVKSDNPGHKKHAKDFAYAGPRDANGNPAKSAQFPSDPTQDGDAWCNSVE
ncbi:MAG: hypothetical protein WCO78_04860 [Candidatus Roizmanbacteria bacterium]